MYVRLTVILIASLFGFLSLQESKADLIQTTLQSGEAGTLDFNPDGSGLEIATFNLIGVVPGSINLMQITFTMDDGDTGFGDADFDNLYLSLNGFDTGVVLNGFGNGANGELTFTASVSTLLSDHLLLSMGPSNTVVAKVFSINKFNLVDDFAIGGTNYVSFPNLSGGDVNATLALSGISAIPEPTSIALCVVAGGVFGCVGFRKRSEKVLRYLRRRII